VQDHGVERAIQRQKGVPLRQKARISLFDGLCKVEERRG
jgi:hypothetical protein